MTKTRIKCIHDYCLECCCGSADEVSKCPAKECPLYPFRKGFGPKNKRNELPSDFPLPYGNSPQKALWAKCLDCADTYSGIRHCEFKDCPLYQYRLRRKSTTD